MGYIHGVAKSGTRVSFQQATLISPHSQGMLVPTGTVLQFTELGPHPSLT